MKSLLFLAKLSFAVLSLFGFSQEVHAVAADHVYEFNGSLADSMGGPSMVSAGGTLGTSTYSFGVGQGPNVSNVLSNTAEYSIEVEFQIADVTAYRSVVSFNNLTQDIAFYILNGSLRLYNYSDLSAVCVFNNTKHRLVITREAATKLFKCYVDGVERLSLTDTGNLAVASATGGILHFFRDNGAENATGSIDLIRTYNRVLTATEVANLTSPTTNNTPSLSVANASVSVNEGSPATNSGSFSDAQGNATVTITASLGSVTQNNAAGTWSWSHTPEDGPQGPLTVTITATDNGSPPSQATTTFSLTAINVAPTYDLGNTVSLSVGTGTYQASVGFNDPGNDTWTGTVNYGDGSGTAALSVTPLTRSFELSHTFTSGGRFTVSTTLNDDDAGSQNDSVQVDVLRSPINATSTVSDIRAYSATLHGTVNPNHSQHRGLTTAWFEYATDMNFTVALSSTAPQTLTVTTEVPAAISLNASVAQLKADTDYFVRLVAENEAGISYGNVISFHSSYPVASDVTFNAATGLTGGGEIYRPLPGVINAAGRLAFKALGTVGSGGITSANDSMLLSDASGILRVIGQEGMTSAAGGTLSGSFNNLVISPNGSAVVAERFLNVPTTQDNGYLVSQDGIGLEFLSQEGDAAGSGGTFIGHTGRQAVDDLDRVYFQGTLANVPSTQNSGIWYETAGMLNPLAIEGQDVSSLTGDPAWLGNVALMVSAAGDGAAFSAALQNNPNNLTQKTSTALNAAIFSGGPGAIELVARKGDVISGAGKLGSFSAVSRSTAGDHAFLSLLSLSTSAPLVSSSNDQVLVAKIDGASHLVARENTTELDSGIRVVRFGNVYVSGSGEVIFQGWGVGTGITTANDGFLCRWSELNGLEILAREGSAAPGTGATLAAFQTLSVSPGGAIVQQVTLSNGRIALLRALPGSSLSLVVQTTQTVVLNGVSRSILSLGIHATGTGSGGGGGGLGTAINDDGAVFTVLSIGGNDYVARVYRP